MKTFGKQMKETERKLGREQTKVKDLEDEQMILMDKHSQDIEKKQSMFKFQLDDQKRRN